MEIEFTANRQRIRATREQVIEALRDILPERIQCHSVEIGGKRYPVKQAFSVAFGIDRSDFVTLAARRQFQRLGFKLTTAASARAERTEDDGYPPRRPAWTYIEIGPATVQSLDIGFVILYWSHWERWDDLLDDCRGGGGIQPPVGKPGVYEVKLYKEPSRLTIGRASDLNGRIKYGLVRGTQPHDAGRRIRENENTKQVMVRWAITDRPAAAEEELHQCHLREFGALPKYTERT